MKVTEKKLSNGKIQLKATATVDDVNSALQQAHMAFASSMGMKPMPGKTIEEAAKEQMGITNLDSVVESQAIESLIPHALDRRNIIPAYMPEVKATSPFKRDAEFSFELEVEPKPEYELKSYEPVSFSAPKFVFNEELVDAQLAELSERYIGYEADDSNPDKTIEADDIIKIAMEASENGVLMKGLSTEGRTYVVGKGYMPPSFDNELIGMKVGETKEFTFEGPDFDENMNECTKKVDAKVTVLELQKEVKPEINDEWIKTHLPLAKDLESLRADIRRDLEKGARAQYDAFVRQLAAAEAAKQFEGKIADEVYESTRNNMVANIRRQLQNEGKTWEAFIEENGGEQQFGMMLMLQIREMLVQGFVMDAIFKHNKMSLTEEDIEAACAAINPQAPAAQLRHQMETTGQGFVLRETAERLKANNYLVDTADITYVDMPSEGQ